MNEIEEDWNDYIGRMTPQGKVTLIPISGQFAHPFYIIPGPNGNLWFTEGGAATHGIVELNPSTLQMTNYPLYGEPIDITVGPDGNLWFTDIYDGNFGRLNPVTGIVNRFSIPTPNSNPWGITAGADGNIWFTEYTGNAIGRINPNTTPTTMVTEFPLPASNSQPTEITSGPDGNVWFAESIGGKIGKITTR